MGATTTIGELEDGAVASVSGRVRRAAEILESPGGEPCVHWEIRSGLGEATPMRSQSTDFWIEDETGRALVRMDDVRVEARSERREEIVGVLDADIQHVSDRLRQLKIEKREARGPKASALGKEQKSLRNVATLLCAIRAQAHGNVHVGGSLEGQQRYIEERSRRLRDHEAVARSLPLAVARWELTVAEGQRVEVTGAWKLAPAPAGVGLAGGYRDRPTCMQASAPADGPLVISGLGDLAPRQRTGLRESSGGGRRPEPAAALPTRSDRWIPMALAAAILVVIAVLLVLR